MYDLLEEFAVILTIIWLYPWAVYEQ